MKTISKLSLVFSSSAVMLASCALAQSGETAKISAEEAGYTIEEMGSFNRPWAIEFLPGTETLAITEKSGTLKLMKPGSGETVWRTTTMFSKRLALLMFR